MSVSSEQISTATNRMEYKRYHPGYTKDGWNVHYRLVSLLYDLIHSPCVVYSLSLRIS